MSAEIEQLDVITNLAPGKRSELNASGGEANNSSSRTTRSVRNVKIMQSHLPKPNFGEVMFYFQSAVTDNKMDSDQSHYWFGLYHGPARHSVSD